MIYMEETAFQAGSKAERDMMAAFGAYAEALEEAGLMAEGDRLQPTAAAMTVRIVDGETMVLSGPHSRTEEQLVAYIIINAPSRDVALSWAARCPGASRGAVEIRPIWTAD
jgi:hypothetical protein